jgi:hypothetical protein
VESAVESKSPQGLETKKQSGTIYHGNKKRFKVWKMKNAGGEA